MHSFWPPGGGGDWGEVADAGRPSGLGEPVVLGPGSEDLLFELCGEEGRLALEAFFGVCGVGRRIAPRGRSGVSRVQAA